jgi:hypothetical protein
MKICIFGAGAIGGFVATHLAQVPGVDVSVVARGAQLAAIRERGLRVVTPQGETSARVQATDRPADLGPQDVVFIALKQHQVAPALDGLSALLGPQTAWCRPPPASRIGTSTACPARTPAIRSTASTPAVNSGDGLGPSARWAASTGSPPR